MKKLLSTVLLLIFLFQMAGYYFVFKIQQREIKKEFKRLLFAGIAEDKLVVIEFDKNRKPGKGEEIKFIENHEILYHNTFYDIVRKEIHGSVTKYFCIADHDETILFAQLNKVLKNEMNKKSDRKKQNTSLKQMSNLFAFSVIRPDFNAFSLDFSSGINYQFSLKLWNPSKLTPPPKV